MDPSSEASTSRVKLDTIPLYLIDGKATVWDPQAAATLHCIHNIGGLRAGTLPGVTQQNGFLGLPITLMPEETAYLVRQGIAHLVPVATTPTLPTEDEVERRTETRLSRIRQVEAAMREVEKENRRMAKERFEKGGEKARAKREARAKAREEKARAKALSEGGVEEAASEEPAKQDPGTSDIHTVPEDGADQPAAKTDDGSKDITGNHFHPVPSHPLFPQAAYGDAITTIPHPLFDFPATPRDRALVATFTDLLQRNIRVGLGPRFGSEYLIYPGDYLRYHAWFNSQVLVRDEPLKPTEIVAWGRLGTGTKKGALLCCWDDEVRDGGEKGAREEKDGEVEYYSLEWSSFG